MTDMRELRTEKITHILERILPLIDGVYFHIVTLTVRGVRAYTDPRIPKGAGSPNVATSELEEETAPHTFKSIGAVLSLARGEVLSPVQESSIVMYAAQQPVFIYSEPTIDFDTKSGIVPYGETVMVKELRGRFARVTWRTVEGWARKDELVDRALLVLPDFAPGEENAVDAREILRAYVRFSMMCLVFLALIFHFRQESMLSINCGSVESSLLGRKRMRGSQDGGIQF